jgi:hypothetical protein
MQQVVCTKLQKDRLGGVLFSNFYWWKLKIAGGSRRKDAMGEFRKNFGRIRRILDIPTESFFSRRSIQTKGGTMVYRAPSTASFPFPISAENVPSSS